MSFVRDRLEDGVAGGVAVNVVDRLEAVEVDEQQRRLAFVALQVGDRAFELAHEAAPVADVEQRIGIGARFEFADPAFRPRNLGLQALDFGEQQRPADIALAGFRLGELACGHVHSSDAVRRRHLAPIRAELC